MAKQLRVGDILEVRIKGGFAYIQYIYKHPKYPPLIRVIKGTYSSRPSDLNAIANHETNWKTFVALKVFLRLGIVELVGHAGIPEEDRTFPVFRIGFLNDRTKKVEVWRLWDGEKEWIVGNLTQEQRKLPIRNVIGGPLLISRIEEGYDYIEAEF